MLSLASALIEGEKGLWEDLFSPLSLNSVLPGGKGDCGEIASALLSLFSGPLGDDSISELLSLNLELVGSARDLDGDFSSLLSLNSGLVEWEGDLVEGVPQLLPLSLSPDLERGVPWRRRRSTGSGHDCLNPGLAALRLSIVRGVWQTSTRQAVCNNEPIRCTLRRRALYKHFRTLTTDSRSGWRD